MTDFYIDPDTGSGSGVGSEADPFAAWSEATFAAGSSYFQKRGTTTTTSVNLIVTGTIDNRIVFGSYGTGERPIIHTSTGNCITANGREYVTFKDFELIADDGNGIAVFVSDITAARGVLIQNIYVHDCQQIGISIAELPGKASYLAMTDDIIEDCESRDNGGHGISMSPALTDGCVIRRCTASNNGLVLNSWGIYMRGRGIKCQSTQWNVVSGTVYQIDGVVYSSMQTGEIILDVAAPGRTFGGATNPIHLTEGTYGALASNEWAQSGDDVQIDIGENPDSKSIIFVTANTTGGIIEDCIAHNHTDTNADGVGIGFDHVTTNGIIRGCTSYNNDLDGIQVNVCKGCKVFGNITYGNLRGIDLLSTDDVAFDVVASNNISFDNGTNLYCVRAPKASFYNNISTGATTEGLTVDTESTGATHEYNLQYDNVANGDTDATDLLVDPLLNADYSLPSNSPCVGAGTKWWGLSPRPDTPFEPLPDSHIDIGFQSTWNENHPKNL